MKWSIFTALLLSLILLQGCSQSSLQGGTGAGNPTTLRSVIGSVPASSPPTLLAQANENCAADLVIATDSIGNTTTSEVEPDCSFSITLETETSYIISFVLNDVFVSTLLFESGITGFSTEILPLSDCELESDELNLGTITFTGSLATPENEPLEQTDKDCDGIPDLEDSDDDNDGTPDAEETDCDLDGFNDDEDEGDEECDVDGDNSGLNRIFEVKPRHDPQPDLGNDRVDVDKDIRARTGCVLDQSSVTNETFRVESETDTIACTYEFSGSSSLGIHMTCKHDDQPMLLDTVYTATVDGVLCEDGREIVPTSWQWRTELTDDDDGDDEDDFDDEITAEFAAAFLEDTESALAEAQTAIDEAPAEADLTAAQDKVDDGLEKLAEAQALNDESQFEEALDKAEDAAALAEDALEAVEDAVEDLEDDDD